LEQARVSQVTTAKAWASRLTHILNASLGGTPDRFPVKVGPVALDYSRQAFPDDPIRVVEGDPLGRFEGCLRPIGDGKPGWGILHNTGVSPGRARFTLAHEFGHYLAHRHLAGTDGFSCSADDIARGQAAGRNIEREADEFAAALLMPFDDFRRQVGARDRADLHLLSACADRYGTSLLATVLRWLAYTERRAVLVVARDGFVDWSRSSEPALRTGAYLRTRGGPPVEVPAGALMGAPDLLLDMRAGIARGPSVWFGEESVEMTLVADAYDFTASLILLGDAADRPVHEEDEDAMLLPVDRRIR
jgi:hypothetical protein